MIQYVYALWQFDGAAFNEALREFKADNQLTWREMAELSGHYESDSGVAQLGKAADPTIAGFIALCNLMDRAPLEFYTTL